MQAGASDAAEAVPRLFPSSVPEPCSRNLCSAIKASSCSSADTATDGISQAITGETLFSQHKHGAPRIARNARDPTTKGDATETRDKQATRKYKSNRGTEAIRLITCELTQDNPKSTVTKLQWPYPEGQVHTEATLGKATPEAEPDRAPKKQPSPHGDLFLCGALLQTVHGVAVLDGS